MTDPPMHPRPSPGPLPEPGRPADAPTVPDAPTVSDAPLVPDESPAHAARRSHGTSRRWVLGGGAAVLLAAAGGAGAALLKPKQSPKRPAPAPLALLDAIAAEQALIADLDATTGGSFEVRRGIVQARADHAAHLRVLVSAASPFDRPKSRTPTLSSTGSSSARAPGVARTAKELRSAEQTASTAAARRAASLDGRLATVLASIAACEATHAELFA
ncbi:MAG: hypothetical protein ABI345_00250 [Jatrophihabitans sp.]